MSRRLLAIAATAALTFTFAACDVGGDGPVTEPPQQVGTSDGGGAAPSDGGGAAPSDNGGDDDKTVAAPDIPAPDSADYAGMDEHTAEGAEQATRFFIANIYWGYQSGSTKTLKTLYGPDCSGCIDYLSDIQSNHISSTRWTETQISDIGIRSYESNEYDLEIGYIFTVGAHDVIEDGSNEIDESPVATYTAISGLNWAGGEWSVSGLQISETESEL